MRLLGAAACAALVLAAAPALAQGVDEFGPYGGLGDKTYESPQNFALELRFGPYRPNVDNEFNGSAAPYQQIFGTKKRYLIGLELDWQALRIPMVGTFGPGIGWGYTTASGSALLTDGSGGRAAQDTSLSVMPMYAVGVLRVDVLARQTPVPLVAYAKAGFGYALWWSSSGGSTSHAADGRVARDASYGYQFALGGMFLLDSIDQDAAIEMDNATGINNSYFFMEWYYSNLNGFGSGNQMQVGTNTWMLGLAFEL